jgi:hypothetical protein
MSDPRNAKDDVPWRNITVVITTTVATAVSI